MAENRGSARGGGRRGSGGDSAIARHAEAAAPNGGSEYVAEDSAEASAGGSGGTVFEQLKERIDPRHVKTREGWRDRNGNQHMVEYVEWHTVADILDRVAPTWSHAVRSIVQIGDMVAVTAAITIEGVTREGVGTGTAENETGIKKAEHDALKRAAVKFGIARELYQREDSIIETQGSSSNQFGGGPGSDKPRNFKSMTESDLVTPKQLGMIRARARELGVDADEASRHAYGIPTEELSKKGASWLIDNIASIAEELTGHTSQAPDGEQVPHCRSHGPAKYVEWTEEGKGLQAAWVCPHRGTPKDCKFAQKTTPKVF